MTTTTATGYNAFFHAIRRTAIEWGQTATTAATAIWSSVYAFAHREPEADPVGCLPMLTPETWAGVVCHCGHCPTCSWYKRIVATVHADDHRDGHQVSSSADADPVDDSPRWRSAVQALQTFATSAGRLSPKAGTGSSLEELRDYGVAVQRERTPGSTSRSDDYVEVERAVRRALPPDRCEGLSYEQATQVLLLRTVGVYQREKTSGLGRPWTRPTKVPVADIAEHYEVSPAAVRRLVKRAMHAIRVELAGRGLTPLPRLGTRAHHEAAARRKELGQ